MAAKQGTASGVLLGVAVALALQIPTTIALIPDLVTRSMVQVFVLLAVVVCATLVKPREVASMVVNSLRPPPATQDPPGERVSLRPPPVIDIPDLHGFELDEPAPSKPTPRETPSAKSPSKR